MTTRVTVDLDQLGFTTANECIDTLERQADFLQFCCLAAKPADPDVYAWPTTLRDAANALRKVIEGPDMTL